jgi:hypothetical protein
MEIGYLALPTLQQKLAIDRYSPWILAADR